jgi:hypothetical protein
MFLKDGTVADCDGYFGGETVVMTAAKASHKWRNNYDKVSIYADLDMLPIEWLLDAQKNINEAVANWRPRKVSLPARSFGNHGKRLSDSEVHILHILSLYDHVPLQTISMHCLTEKAAKETKAVLDYLKSGGLVEDLKDVRAFGSRCWRLTSAGKQTVDNIIAEEGPISPYVKDTSIVETFHEADAAFLAAA